MCKKEKDMIYPIQKTYTDIVGRFYINKEGYPVYIEKFNNN